MNSSVQYQIFMRPPNGIIWTPTYPIERYDKPEQAMKFVRFYQQWDVEQQKLRYEYCIATVKTVFEYGEVMKNGN